MASLKLMYQCTVCFFAGPTKKALLHHEYPGLVLIGKYLVMSNSNIYSEVHIHWLESLPLFLLTRFSRHLLFRRFFFRFQSVAFISPYSETMTSNKLTYWVDRDVRNLITPWAVRRAPRRTGAYDQIEQLSTHRKFHFCSHRNFPFFFLNGKRPLKT